MSSNYPGGFASGITIRGVNLTTTNPGEIFWVNNGALAKGGLGGSNGNDGTYRKPFATVDFAVSQCTANRGDIVLVMPNHNEGGVVPALFDIDIAGVAVVGLGYKGNRPTFDFDDTDVDVVISAANCTLANVNLRASVGDVVRGIVVNAANARIDSIEFLEEGSNDNFIDFILTSATNNTSDGLAVTNCKVLSADTGNNSFIELMSIHDGLELVGNVLQLGVQDGEMIIGQNTATDPVTGLYIADNDIFRLNTASALLIESTADTTNGIVTRNNFGHTDPSAMTFIETGSDVRFTENYSIGADDKSGKLMPAIEATSDMRLKTNIQKIGMRLGFNIYQWDWNDTAKALGINDPTVGVMAQEVLHTGCVVERDGWLRVKYDQLFA